MADEEQGEGIFGAAQAHGVDGGVVGRTFEAAIPREVVVAAVGVAFAVLEVVFFFVREKVGQGVAVVASDEVDRGGGLASALAVEIGRPENALDHFADGIVVAAEEAAGGVAEFAVPFHPATVVGEVADLVESAGIPGLGDELAVGEEGVVGDGFEERRVG